MSLQVALQTGARVDMALTGPIMRQETETGWKHTLFPQVSILLLRPLSPPPPPSSSFHAPSSLHHPTALQLLLFHLVLHSMMQHARGMSAFDSNVVVQPQQQLQ